MTDINLNSNEIKDLLKILKPLYNNKIKLNKYKNVNYDYNNSSINRYIKIIDINISISLSKAHTIYTVLRIYRNNRFINYGYMYGEYIHGKVVNKFILTSNSIISKDGMYSYRLVNYLKLANKLTIVDKVYDYIMKFVRDKTINFDVDVFNIENENAREAYIEEYKNNKILIVIYCITWIIEMYNINNDNQDINLNNIYNDVMFGDKDKEMYSSLYLRYKNEVLDLVTHFKYFTVNDNSRLGLGQKVMTFNYKQLKEYNNIIHYQWKEVFINKLVTDIVYNMISPCFPIFVDWILIRKSNRFIYDNENIYRKILNSDKAKDLIHHINAVRDGFNEMHGKSRSKILARLIKKFKKTMELIESNILMSDVSICLISEYAGRSMYQHLYKNKEINIVGDLYSNYDVFRKYIFEIIFSLYALNLKGVIQGDMHLSNVLLNIKNIIEGNNNYVIYNLNSENIFAFKHKGVYPCIIDYGRSYVNINMIDDLDENIIKSVYIKHEKKRIIAELNKIFPNKKSKTSNFDKLFTHFMAVDIYNFTNKLSIFIDSHSKANNINVNKDIVNFLTKISKKSYSLLYRAIDDEKINLNPNYELLLEFFGDFKINHNLDGKVVSDIFTIDKMNVKKNIMDELIDNIPLNSLNAKLKTKLKKKELNEDLEIEGIVNKEYYESRKTLASTKISVTESIDDVEDTSST